MARFVRRSRGRTPSRKFGRRKSGRRIVRRRFSRGLKRGRRSAKNYARVVETDEFATQSYALGAQRVVGLSTVAFPRAAAVAIQYKWYRLAKIDWEYRPKYNVFQEATASTATPSIPYLWTLRAKEMPVASFDPLVGTGVLNNYQECGAVMRKFNRKITLRYKPNTLERTTIQSQAVPDNTHNVFSPVYNKWFPTQDPNNASTDVDNIPSVIYYGHYDYVDQDTVSAVQPAFDVFLRCTWEFKEPQLPNLSGS